MKQRYDESFLFPQSQEDFGRSLVFPQGNLHGYSRMLYTDEFVFPQAETDDYGRALMFPQGQLHGLRGLGAAPSEAEIKTAGATFGLDPDDPSQRNLIISEIEKRKVQKAADDAYDAWIAARNAAAPAALAILQYDSTGRATDASIQAANAFQAQQAAPQEAAFVAAEQKVEAVVQANYAIAAAIPNTIEEIVARAREGASITAKNEGFDANIQKAAADAAEMSARRGDSYLDQMRAGWEASYAAKSRADAIAAQQAAAAAAAAAAAKAAAAAAAPKFDIVAVDIAVGALKRAGINTVGMSEAQLVDALNKLYPGQSFKISNYTPGAVAAVTTTNQVAGTVTTTTPATGTVTTTSPTTGTTTTANVVTGAVTVTTGSGQTVSGTGSVTAGNTSTTVNQATGTVTTTNTTTGATTVTNAATGQSQTGTAQPTSYILDFHDNQFWLTTSAGAPVRNGSADFKTPADFLSNSGITLPQTTLTAAASVKFANNHGVTTVVNSAGGTTTTNPTTGTVTTTNPVTGTVTTTNTTTGTTTTTTPATGTTTTTTTPATDTGKLALYALLGVLLLRGAVR